MPIRKYAVTLTRRVIESVTLQVDAPSKQDATMRAGHTLKDQDWEWSREVEDARVGSVEIAQSEPADPMAVPDLLKRAAT